jgi:hypothetical protein
MSFNRSTWRVEVTFVARPPTREMERAAGVSGVRAGGHTLRCLVSGSFQPFLEALRGREVIGLTSIPVLDPTAPCREGGGH